MNCQSSISFLINEEFTAESRGRRGDFEQDGQDKQDFDLSDPCLSVFICGKIPVKIHQRFFGREWKVECG